MSTKLGKLDYYQPKLSRKTHIKELLPSYKESNLSVFQDAAKRQKVQLNYKRKVGLGADLSPVMNDSFKPEKDFSKINNSVIEVRDRSEVYISPKNGSKLIKRNINISDTNNFLKSYDGSMREYLQKVEEKQQTTANLKERNIGYYDFCTQENSSWLEGRSKKRSIGPHHNSTSSAFTLQNTLPDRIGFVKFPALSRNFKQVQHASAIEKIPDGATLGLSEGDAKHQNRVKDSNFLNNVEVNKKLVS